jgi:hypothetical protein
MGSFPLSVIAPSIEERVIRMRALLAATALIAALSGGPARAEKRIFIIDNNPDGYGVDRCLASGLSCGNAVANSYCRSREFMQAVSFRRIERDEITGVVPASVATCRGACQEFVAIECNR